MKLPGTSRRVVPHDRFSVPSGHTAAAFVVMCVLGWFVPASLVVTVPWAAAVALSRVYLGVHYPSDTLAGMALGLASAAVGLAVATLV